MPEEVSPQQVAKVIDLRKGGAKWHDIAKEVGIAESTAQRHWYNQPKKSRGEKLHKLSAKDINKVINLTQEGMSARDIAKETGLSVYNVYHARNNGNVKSAAPRTAGSTLQRDKKIFELKQRGLKAEEIAARVDESVATVYAGIKRYKAKLNKGEQLNGNINHGPDSGSIKPANIENLAGILFEKTNRAIADFTKGAEGLADKLRRRLSELLSASSLR
jgi:DNA-binding NarL/FixJ family response regulator